MVFLAIASFFGMFTSLMVFHSLFFSSVFELLMVLFVGLYFFSWHAQMKTYSLLCLATWDPTVYGFVASAIRKQEPIENVERVKAPEREAFLERKEK